LDGSEQSGKDKWWPMIFGIAGYGGGSAVLIAFLRQLYQSASSMKKGFTLPSHQDKLGLQAAIGDDFHALIRSWTTIKPGEKFFQGQTLYAGIIEILLYVALWGMACVSIKHLLGKFDHYFVLTALGATFLCITLLPVLVFIPMLAQWRINQTFQDKTDKAAAFTHYILALCILTFSVILLYIAILFKFYVMIAWGVILLSGVFVVTYWIFCCFSDDKKASIKKWIYEFCRNRQPDRILLIVDDLDRCEGDDLLEIMESIMLLCQDEQINKRLHVCMLVKSHTVEVKLREKYKYLLEDVAYGKEKERLIRENFEKLFDAHLSLPDLKEGNVEEVLRSFLKKLVTDDEKEKGKGGEGGGEGKKESSPAHLLTPPHPGPTEPSGSEPSEGAPVVPPSPPKTSPREPTKPTGSEPPVKQSVLSGKEREDIIEEAKNFVEPYKNYWTPRSLKRLTTQFLLARSLSKENDTRKITATILHLQRFSHKNKDETWFPDESRASEIIRMVVWCSGSENKTQRWFW